MKKRILKKGRLCIFLVLMLIAQSLSLSLSHEGLSVHALTDPNFSFDVLDATAKTATITGYSGSKTEIEIPSSVSDGVKTYTVTAISDNAFFGKANLMQIIIPYGVTTIGESAFASCSGLLGITFPSSVKSIGISAFADCLMLSSVSMPNSVTSIGPQAFKACSLLPSITIPNSVTTIDWETFDGCSGLTSVAIPNSVTSISGYAFSGCGSLTYITIPSSVTSIGESCFSGSWLLNSVYFNGNAPTMGGDVFLNCASGLKAYFVAGKTGFTNPWNGVPTDTFVRTDMIPVTFDSQGGSTVPPIMADKDMGIAAPTKPAMTGYTFSGWYREAACKNVWNFASDKITTATTLFAKWNPNTYLIKFSGNGSTSGTMSTLSMTYNVAKSLTTNGYNKAGASFMGWAKTSTGSVAYTNAASVKNLTATNGATINLYAKWGAPIASAASYNYNSIKVAWAYAGSATAYKVYWATSATGTYSLVYTASSSARSYVNTGLVTGKTYYYKVYPVAGGKTYSYSTYKSAEVVPATPTVTLSKPAPTSVKVSWSGVSGATKYQVYRTTSLMGTYTLVYTATSSLRSWTNPGLTVGKTYYYKVRAYHLEGTTMVYGSTSAVKSLKI